MNDLAEDEVFNHVSVLLIVLYAVNDLASRNLTKNANPFAMKAPIS